MVRFSCFHTNIHSNKSKKTVHLSIEAMHKPVDNCSENQAVKDFIDPSNMKLSQKIQGDAESSASHVMSLMTSSPTECGWKFISETDTVVHDSRQIKKSISLGSGLDREGQASTFNDWEGETDLGYSRDGSHDPNERAGSAGGGDPEINASHVCEEVLPSDSPRGSSELVNKDSIFSVGDPLQNKDSIFSIGDPQQLEKEGHENSDTHFSGEGAVESNDHKPHNTPIMVKSSSLPNVRCSSRCIALISTSHSRSAEDLYVLDLRRKDMVVHEIEPVQLDQGRDHTLFTEGKNDREDLAEDGYDSYNYVGSAKDWVVPIMDGGNLEKNMHGETLAHQWEESPGKDFKTKRIEEWVTSLSNCSPLAEAHDEISNVVDQQVKKGGTIMDDLTAARIDGKVTPGMEAAKRYISSLSAAATAAQLANHGLVMIPFLSAYASLRAVNLSGNAIVRINAGSLPRGLHVLNLSKNHISVVEGLRELTRLRVLDLSYNRIFRIGHGLASCSSLKELYLAGNKISEVEGLHRLLKLNVLDLRFNKISTAKSLGQLAANYNSLQAISLEGNPAQKNVGDEQLKKCLQGLLPHLAYYNRQSIKAGSLKDTAERSTRLGISTDRGHRSDHKTLRKASHSSSAQRVSSSIHGHRSQAVVSPKVSKSRPVRLPPAPTGTKMAQHRLPPNDLGSKLLTLRLELSMRRSRSEGTLAVL